MLWLWEFLRIRGRMALFLAIGTGLIVYLPPHWGASKLGFVQIRESQFAWIAGSLFAFFVLLVIVRFIDRLDATREAAYQRAEILAALHSLDEAERHIMLSALRAAASTVLVPSPSWQSGVSLEKKGLLHETMGNAPPQRYEEQIQYVIPPKVWMTLTEGQVENLPQEIPSWDRSWRRSIEDFIGIRVRIQRVEEDETAQPDGK